MVFDRKDCVMNRSTGGKFDEVSVSVHCPALVKNRNHSAIDRMTRSDKVSSQRETSTSHNPSVFLGTLFHDRKDSSDAYGWLI